VGALVSGGDVAGNIEVTGPITVDSPLVEVPLPWEVSMFSVSMKGG
jgi:hypothetical protein